MKYKIARIILTEVPRECPVCGSEYFVFLDKFETYRVMAHMWNGTDE